MKFGVLVFPGSNCDHDTHHVVDAIARQPVTYLWHASEDLQGCDAILVPGGFAYGDYLRTGAIAKLGSPSNFQLGFWDAKLLRFVKSETPSRA